MNSVSPLPEALDGRKWIIRQSPAGSGSIDTVARKMAVPLRNTAEDRFVRNHEMAHGKITPRVSSGKQCLKYSVSMLALQSCEDLRVHHFLNSAGIECTGSITEQDAVRCVETFLATPRDLAALLLSALHTHDFPRILAALGDRLDVTRLNALMAGVRLIDERLQAGRGISRPIGFRNCTIPAAKVFDALFPESGSSGGDDCMRVPLNRLGHNRRQVKWGSMNIEELSLSQTRRSPAFSKIRTFTDEGAVMTAVYRLPVDSRIFSRTRAHKGGTVLIDLSGSMSLTLDDLDRIVAAAPAATIATYSGRSTHGTLHIVARKGRVANSDGLRAAQSSGNGNIVDGPALRWLAKQQAPRLWVSDGYVTGKHDHTSVDLGAEAQIICNKARIRRVEKAQAVADALTKAK
jgi:hypothetical protein